MLFAVIVSLSVYVAGARRAMRRAVTRALFVCILLLYVYTSVQMNAISAAPAV